MLSTDTGPVQLKKRGLSSSSATSSSLRRIKLKRPVLIHRKTPMRKRGDGSRSSYIGTPENRKSYNNYEAFEGTEGSVSARKLVNSLWQTNKTSRDFSELSQHNVSDIPCYYETRRHRRKESAQNYHDERSISSHSTRNNFSATQMQVCDRNNFANNSTGEKSNHLKNLNNNLTASREILKALIHIWSPQKMQSSTFSLISALYTELDMARVHLHKLNKKSIQEKDERELTRRKEKEKILLCFESLIEELDIEKKSRRKAEKINKRLGTVLTQMERSILEASEELEKERRSRERVERVCKELVRGIGEDRAEVEELKRETVNLQEELEREREMLQIADEWREERVQMKLTEAKCQFEEKNKAIDQLRYELKEFMSSDRAHEGEFEIQGDIEGENEIFYDERFRLEERSKEIDDLRNELKAYLSDKRTQEGEFEINGESKGEDENFHNGIFQFEEKNKAIDQLRNDLEAYLNEKNAKVGASEIEEESKGESKKLQEIDSGEDSDLQSIELELDDTDSFQDEEGPSWNFEQFGGSGVNLLDKERQKMHEKELERYNLVKKLRDHMLAGSGFIVKQDKGKNSL